MPMGQLPILEVDGTVMYQSLAIGRFLAKKFGIAGNNDMESYQIDNAVDNINDFRASKLRKYAGNLSVCFLLIFDCSVLIAWCDGFELL